MFAEELVVFADILRSRGPDNEGRAVFLLKMAALELGHMGALRKCVETLAISEGQGTYTEDRTKSRQAGRLIVAFFHRNLVSQKGNKAGVRSESLFEELFSLFTGLVHQTGYDEVVVDDLMIFLRYAAHVDACGRMRRYYEWMRRSMVRSVNWNSLRFLCHELVSEDSRKRSGQEEDNWERDRKFLFSDDNTHEYEGKTGNILSKIILERAVGEQENVSAMIHLGLMLMNGAEGVQADAVREVELFERAITEGSN